MKSCNCLPLILNSLTEALKLQVLYSFINLIVPIESALHMQGKQLLDIKPCIPDFSFGWLKIN